MSAEYSIGGLYFVNDDPKLCSGTISFDDAGRLRAVLREGRQRECGASGVYLPSDKGLALSFCRRPRTSLQPYLLFLVEKTGPAFHGDYSGVCIPAWSDREGALFEARMRAMTYAAVRTLVEDSDLAEGVSAHFFIR